MKKSKKKEKPDFEMIPLPSGLRRMTRKDLIEQVEFMITISNLILERKARNELFNIDMEIHRKTLISHIADLEAEIKRLKGKLKDQAVQHKTAIEQAEAFVFVENPSLI